MDLRDQEKDREREREPVGGAGGPRWGRGLGSTAIGSSGPATAKTAAGTATGAVGAAGGGDVVLDAMSFMNEPIHAHPAEAAAMGANGLMNSGNQSGNRTPKSGAVSRVEEGFDAPAHHLTASSNGSLSGSLGGGVTTESLAAGFSMPAPIDMESIRFVHQWAGVEASEEARVVVKMKCNAE